ncbi:hypothetical protein L7F22_023663 [Adiantum nelumboides]|nr:hypothetical protein [Adiantum nelumboides]
MAPTKAKKYVPLSVGTLVEILDNGEAIGRGKLTKVSNLDVLHGSRMPSGCYGVFVFQVYAGKDAPLCHLNLMDNDTTTLCCAMNTIIAWPKKNSTLRTIEWINRPKWITEDRLYVLACADLPLQKETYILRAMASLDPINVKSLDIPQTADHALFREWMRVEVLWNTIEHEAHVLYNSMRDITAKLGAGEMLDFFLDKAKLAHRNDAFQYELDKFKPSRREHERVGPTEKELKEFSQSLEQLLDQEGDLQIVASTEPVFDKRNVSIFYLDTCMEEKEIVSSMLRAIEGHVKQNDHVSCRLGAYFHYSHSCETPVCKDANMTIRSLLLTVFKKNQPTIAEAMVKPNEDTWLDTIQEGEWTMQDDGTPLTGGMERGHCYLYQILNMYTKKGDVVVQYGGDTSVLALLGSQMDRYFTIMEHNEAYLGKLWKIVEAQAA